MLKTRITEQYGLKVPFVNAGMAFIATAPLVRTVCAASIIDEMISGAEAVIRKRLEPMVFD